jgi:hypothetical protein
VFDELFNLTRLLNKYADSLPAHPILVIDEAKGLEKRRGILKEEGIGGREHGGRRHIHRTGDRVTPEQKNTMAWSETGALCGSESHIRVARG